MADNGEFVENTILDSDDSLLIHTALGGSGTRLTADHEVKLPHKVPDNPFAQRPHWKLPYFDVDTHVRREGIMEQIFATLETSQTATLAANGLGGVGKTQVARYYCHLAYQEEKEALGYDFVGWVQGSDEDAVKRSYIQLGQGLKIIPYDCPPEEAIPRVKAFFESQSNWLLVFDDIQDADWLDELLPQPQETQTKTHILITTRNEHFDTGMCIAVEVMTEAEALALLQLLSRCGETDEEIELLNVVAEKLGRLPLALSQAGSYMANNFSETANETISNYLARYAETQQTMSDYDEQPLGHIHEPVTVTWLMNFEEVAKLSDDAVLLLQAIQYLHHNDIPWRVLIRVMDAEQEPTPEARVKTIQALAHLKNYSLINDNPIEESLSIHVLVQRVLCWQSGGLAKNTRMLSEQQVVYAIARDTDGGNESMKAFHHRNRLIPHLNCLLTSAKLGEITHEKEMRIYLLLAQLGDIYLDLRDGGKGIVVYKELMQIILSMFGNESKEYASFLNNFGSLYSYLGEEQTARSYYKKTLAIEIKIYGEDDAHVAKTLDNLGCIYSSLGKYKVAKKHHEKALAIQIHIYGKEHVQVARTLGNLGVIYSNLNDYTCAKEFLEKALAIEIKIYGERHIVVARTLVNLGIVYNKQSDFVSAKAHLEEALPILITAYGEKHVDVAKVLVNCGSLCGALKDYVTAKIHLERALTILINAYGEEHVVVSRTLVNLGNVCQLSRDYVMAKAYYEQALVIQINIYGERHPKIGMLYGNLAELFKKQGELRAAQQYIKRALFIFMSSPDLDVNNSFRSKTMQNKAEIDALLEQLKARAKQMGISLDEAERLLSRQRASTGMSTYKNTIEGSAALTNYVTTTVVNFRAQGEEAFKAKNYVVAIFYYQQMLQSQAIDKAMVYFKLARCYDNLSHWQEAVDAYYQALQLLNNAEVLQPKALARCHRLIGIIYQEQFADDEQALTQFEFALNYLEEIEDTDKTINTRQLLQQKIQLSQHRQAFQAALELGIECFGEENHIEGIGHFQQGLVHAGMVGELDIGAKLDQLHYHLGQTYVELGQIEDAKVYLKLSYNWRLENLGERHQDTMLILALLSSFGEYDHVINVSLSSV